MAVLRYTSITRYTRQESSNEFFKGTVTQVISKHKKIELAPNMFNILKMSKGDVFRIFDFAREVS